MQTFHQFCKHLSMLTCKQLIKMDQLDDHHPHGMNGWFTSREAHMCTHPRALLWQSDLKTNPGFRMSLMWELDSPEIGLHAVRHDARHPFPDFPGAPRAATVTRTTGRRETCPLPKHMLAILRLPHAFDCVVLRKQQRASSNCFTTITFY